jgi:hypothetical protein
MKKTASKSRPLSLRRETVRVLASSQLASAQGGNYTDLIRDRVASGDNERNSNCAICLVRPPGGFPDVGSVGQTGGCGTVFTQTGQIIVFP